MYYIFYIYIHFFTKNICLFCNLINFIFRTRLFLGFAEMVACRRMLKYYRERILPVPMRILHIINFNIYFV